MRILITGASGMLGADVRRAGEQAGHEVIALSRAELDIRDFGAVREALARHAPHVVINCAAFTDVDGAETDPSAHLVNGEAPGLLAAAAAEQGAWILHISSDYVFAGDKPTPYLESDATGPVSAYGTSKLKGERNVARAAPDAHTIVRSSWLFGAPGRCFPDTVLRLAAERDELSVVDDQVGCPTFTGHLAGALVDLVARAEPPVGVVHCAAAGQCTWFEFAEAVLDEAGVGIPVRPVSTAEFPRPARRPAYSVLRSARPETPELPHWREGLSEYLHARLVAG
ncbi:MAG TPA: dTDP-4-dehydrorhamnose reductase [Solirubrobacteraceae bacterium]|jgi:dTDP-4-dehydrorhamnose reductase|nr:dTDP-4-dehydrorhamnose reductase [Solirubrobacteraceae bacterium]